MRIAEIVRRAAAPAGALLGAAAICVACSSSTNGSPDSQPPGGNLSVGSQPVPSLSLPSVSGLPTDLLSDVPSALASDLPSIGGDQANSAFCKDFTSFDPSEIGDPSASLKLFDKIAADAPSGIKSDAEKVRDALHKAVGGDESGMESFQTSLAKLTSYFTAHCAG